MAVPARSAIAATLLALVLAGGLVLPAWAGPEREAHPHGFALVIGDCVWKPPSAAAAVEAVMYFFGVGASFGGEAFVHDFHVVLADQYVAAGSTREHAVQEVANFDRCVASYTQEQ